MINVYSYRFSFILLMSVVLGGVTGYLFGPSILFLKPLGEIFLNFMFTCIPPLVFFSVSAAIASMQELARLRKILAAMFLVFFCMGIAAAIYMLVVVAIFPPAHGVTLVVPEVSTVVTSSFGSQLASIFSVSDLSKLASPHHILALILFSVLVGAAVSSIGEKGKAFQHFLQSGMAVFTKVITLVMYYSPIGFFAFFAVLVHELGPKLFQSYAESTLIYYIAATIYFFAFYTIYAYIANRAEGVRTFWRYVLTPAVTGLATCSSAACIPVVLQATKKMGVPSDICETLIPLGTVIHKQGSILGGVIKIAFLFGLYQMNLWTLSFFVSAIFVSILVGTVMGAIPSGGMLAELFILSVYGFPPQALLIIATISILIDPLATMLNVCGNAVASLLVTRAVN